MRVLRFIEKLEKVSGLGMNPGGLPNSTMGTSRQAVAIARSLRAERTNRSGYVKRTSPQEKVSRQSSSCQLWFQPPSHRQGIAPFALTKNESAQDSLSHERYR